MKKRLFGVLVAVVLLLCVTLPFVAMADGLTALDWIEVSGIQVPEVGAMPTVEGIEIAWPAEQQGSLAWAGWYYYNENDDYVEFTEPFFGGHQFYLELVFDMPEGTEIGDETLIMIPGEVYRYSAYENGIVLEFYLPGESITEVSVTGVPESIEVGQQASIDTIEISADANYILYPTWEEFTEGEWFAFSGEFQKNGIYRLNLEFYPNAGYQMDVEKVYINGEETYFYGQSNSWMGVEVRFPLTEEITRVEIMGLQTPEDGLAVDLTMLHVPSDANYSITSARWTDTDTGEEVTGKFEKGKSYSIDVVLTPNEGYHFAQWIMFVVNGVEIGEDVVDMTSAVYWDAFSLKEPIAKVEITGVKEPVIGEAPTTEGIVVNGCDAEVSWIDENHETVTVFEKGKRYWLIVYMFAPEGSCFTDNTVVTINGKAPTGDYYQQSDDFAVAFNIYSFCEVIPSVTVQVPQVIMGQPVPTEVEVPEGANYYAEVSWYTWDEEYGYQSFDGAVLTPGKLYNMDVNIYPDAGYDFDPIQTSVEIIGGDPVVYVSAEDIYCMFNYNFADIPQIDKIELNNVPVPELGKPATVEGIQIPADANYTIANVMWMEIDAAAFDLVNGAVVEAETFQAGKYYVLAATLEANSGYVFDWKVPVYVNGEQIDVLIYGENCFNTCLVPVVFEPLAGGAVAGDINGDGVINNDDVIQLMWHNLFPEQYPIENGDITGDGQVNNDDVVYLMWHNLFPENYPL